MGKQNDAFTNPNCQPISKFDYAVYSFPLITLQLSVYVITLNWWSLEPLLHQLSVSSAAFAAKSGRVVRAFFTLKYYYFLLFLFVRAEEQRWETTIIDRVSKAVMQPAWVNVSLLPPSATVFCEPACCQQHTSLLSREPKTRKTLEISIPKFDASCYRRNNETQLKQMSAFSLCVLSAFYEIK